LKKAATIITLACLAFAINNTVFALDPGDNNFFQAPTQNNASFDIFAKTRENMVDKEKAANSENSLDPDRYYIGGGDMFSISVIGLPSIRYMVEINQQGDMYIPELGLLKLGKINLSEAQEKIKVYIQEKLKKQNSIYVQLVKVKSVTVSINGAVEKPGTYVLSGGGRILDVIRTANKETMPSINDCDFREVLCKNKDSLNKIDVFNYLLKNDFSGNPYLYPGDNISLLYATKRIFLNTQAKSGISGWVPIKGDAC
jgi:protein involved in polysaccharide export with SLBB domain